VGLDSFSPPQLTALRFLIATTPAIVLARPVPWRVLVPLGLTLFAGQFLLQFFAIANGMPPGLASIVVQTQAFFTILFAAVALRERPQPQQLAGVAIAFAGLVLIALTVGGDLSASGFALTLGSAISWGIGNVLLKRVPDVDMLSLIVWLSLVPPAPSLALSMLLDAPAGPETTARFSWLGIGAALYLGVVATVVAYAIWARLLRRYPVATVAPFALLVPIVGAYSSSVAFGERFGRVRLLGMAFVLLGVAVTVLSGPRRDARASA
jgi:O-acetylserine/cysteine efflux transporter